MVNKNDFKVITFFKGLLLEKYCGVMSPTLGLLVILLICDLLPAPQGASQDICLGGDEFCSSVLQRLSYTKKLRKKPPPKPGSTKPWKIKSTKKTTEKPSGDGPEFKFDFGIYIYPTPSYEEY
ncbi:unnamed protein product, partial [Iphiclides podalirius]